MLDFGRFFFKKSMNILTYYFDCDEISKELFLNKFLFYFFINSRFAIYIIFIVFSITNL